MASSNSVRRNLPLPTRSLEERPDEAPSHEAIPDARGAGADTCDETPVAGRLWRENGQVLYQPADSCEAVAVRVRWARPLSGREGAVSVMLAEKKKEVAYLPSLDALAEDSRRVAREELAGGMVMPRITTIFEVKPRFGNYYWTVETDRGRRTFLMTSPENNSLRPSPDVLVLRDVDGNCFEVNPVSGLTHASLRELDKVL